MYFFFLVLIELTIRHVRNLVVFAFDHQTGDLERFAFVLLQQSQQILHGSSRVDDIFDHQHILASQILEIFDSDDFQLGAGRVVFVTLHSNELDRDLVRRIIVASVEREILIELLDFGQQIVKVLVTSFQYTQGDERLFFVIFSRNSLIWLEMIWRFKLCKKKKNYRWPLRMRCVQC